MTDEQIRAKIEALRGVNTIDDWYARNPQYAPSRWAKPANDKVANAIIHASQVLRGEAPMLTGKLMTAKWNGACATCGRVIRAGDEMRWDGKVHCAHGCEPERDDTPMGEPDNWGPEDDFDPKPVPAPTPVPVIATKAVADGKYTIVLADGQRRTLRVRTQPADATFAPGERIVAYLSGSDNDSDYQRCAFLGRDGKVRFWKKYAGSYVLTQCARVLEDPAKAEAAGLAYAMESGNCYHCGRTLTVPASISRGLGPDCAAKLAM